MVLTEAADYLQFLIGTVLSETSGYDMRFANDGNDISDGCMSSGSLCHQLWTIETFNVPCPTDLSGTYTFQYTLGCNPEVTGNANATALCNQYIDQYDGAVILSDDLEWEDSVCDPLVFEIEFDAQIIFYRGDPFTITQTDQYELGDQAFVEVLFGVYSLHLVGNAFLKKCERFRMFQHLSDLRFSGIF